MEKSLGSDHRDRWTQHDLNWTHHFPPFLQIFCGSVFWPSYQRHKPERYQWRCSSPASTAISNSSLLIFISNWSSPGRLQLPPENEIIGHLVVLSFKGLDLYLPPLPSPIYLIWVVYVTFSSRRLGVRSPRLYPFLPHVPHLHLCPISMLCLHPPSTLLFLASLSLTFSCSSLSYNVSFDAHASGHLPVPSPLVFCSGLLWLWFIPWAVY